VPFIAILFFVILYLCVMGADNHVFDVIVMSCLVTVTPISKAASNQRAGRAGRLVRVEVTTNRWIWAVS